MPPAKTIFVDTNAILGSISRIAAQQAVEAHASADCEAKSYSHSNHYHASDEWLKERGERARQAMLAHRLPLAEWAPRNLELLAGKTLTASERIRHQQAMRKLEADGLVILDTRHVKLTDAGKAHVKQITTPAETANP